MGTLPYRTRAALDMAHDYFNSVEVEKIPDGWAHPHKERAVALAGEFAAFGALLTIFWEKAEILRYVVETGESREELMKKSLAERYRFVTEYPEAVSEYLFDDDFDAVAGKNDGSTVLREGVTLVCARLDPAAFETCACRTKTKMVETAGVVMKFKACPEWSLLGYVPSEESPPGNYLLANSDKATRWSCVLGSSVVKHNFSTPLCYDVKTLASINRARS